MSFRLQRDKPVTLGSASPRRKATPHLGFWLLLSGIVLAAAGILLVVNVVSKPGFSIRHVFGAHKQHVPLPGVKADCNQPVAPLQDAVSEIARKFDGVVGIAVSRVGCDWVVGERKSELFPQQSVSKLWVSLTTLDAVDFNGAYKGGIIAPGINLSLDALVAAAAKLPRIAIEAPESTSVIGRTTEEQMLIGVYWGYVAMIEGLVARMKAEIARPVTVISTGGLATLIDTHTELFDSIDPDLTIQGLWLLYTRAKA